MKQRFVTFYGIGVLAIIPFFVAIGLAVLLSAMPSLPKQFLVNTPAAPGAPTGGPTPTGLQKTATLSLVPAGPIGANSQTTVNLEINTGGIPVSAVQAEITFDAQLINVEVVDGPFFPSPITHLFQIRDNANGKIFYAWAIGLNGTAPTGPTGTVATIQVTQIRRNGTTSTPLTFQSQTFVLTPGGGQSDILNTKNSTTLTLLP